MKLWIARDKNGELNLYKSKPMKNEYFGFFYNMRTEKSYVMDEHLFLEITFENSPQQVELKLIED